MRIGIQALNKADLLLALYNNANAYDAQPGLQAVGAVGLPGKRAAAEKAINETKDLWFGYVDLGSGERLLAVDLKGFYADFTEYDRQYGKGRAQEIINELHAGNDQARRMLNSFRYANTGVIDIVQKNGEKVFIAHPYKK